MMRALVIDDDDNVGVAIQAILSRHGVEAVLSARAHAGLRALTQSTFDVVVIDLFLPGMSGLDTIREIRRAAPAMPIVAMTGFKLRPAATPDIDFLAEAVQRGATACVRKPFTPDQLLTAIHHSRSHAPPQRTSPQ